MTSVDSTGGQAGAFTKGAGQDVALGSAGGHLISHIQHSTPSSGSTFSFQWTAPSSSNTGNVRFNVAANAANNNGSTSGDFTYSAQTTVPASAPISLTEVFYFPHVADGGAFTTTLFITNPGPPNTTANVLISFGDFADADGNAIVPTFIDDQGQAFTGSVSFQLAGGTSRRLDSTAASPGIGVGFAAVASDIPVTGSAVFSQFNLPAADPSSLLVAEAGVNPSTPTVSQAIFVDEQGFLTAFAFANPSPSLTANVTFNLLDSEGQVVGSISQTLAPENHTSQFIFQMFGAIADNHFGTLQILSDVPVIVVSLRFLNDFSIFSSVPPFALSP